MTDAGPTTTESSEVLSRIGPYELGAATAFGPRLTGLQHTGGPQLLARLDPDIRAGAFEFRGGHRLWVSPEDPPLTYAPDDHECEVIIEDQTLLILGPVDQAGFVKEIHVSWDEERLHVDHRLQWMGGAPIQAAPWAITQLPLGGDVILPVTAPGRAVSSLQADRSLVLWPYTDLGDPRVSWGSPAVVIRAESGPRLKLGSGPAPGRLAYLNDGWLFVKWFDPAVGGDYSDRGAVGQVFVDEVFCELESLGPLVTLEPGAETRHGETWEALECRDLDSALDLMSGGAGS